MSTERLNSVWWMDGRVWLVISLGIIVPTRFHPFTDIRVGLADVVVGALLIGSLLAGRLGRDLRITALPFRNWLYAFAGVLVMGMLVVWVRLGEISTWALVNKGVGFAVLAAILVFFGAARTPRRALTRYLWAFVLGASALNFMSLVVGTFSILRTEPAFVMYSGDSLRLAGFMKNPNSYGSFVGVALLLQVGLAIHGQPGRRRGFGFMLWLNCALLLVGLLLTISRAGWFATAAGLIVLLIGAAVHAHHTTRLRAMALPLSALLVILATLAATGFGGLVEGVSSFQTGSASEQLSTRSGVYNSQGRPLVEELARVGSDPHGASDRMAINRTALDLYDESPSSMLLGQGLGSFLMLSSETTLGMEILIHNTYLWILVELGAVGLIVLLGFLGAPILYLLRGSWSASSLRWLYLAVLSALTSHLVWSLAHEGLYQRHLWFLLAMTALLMRADREEEQEDTDPGVISSSGVAVMPAPLLPRVVHVTTVPMSLRFLEGQLEYMRGRGFENHVITSPGDTTNDFPLADCAKVHRIEMSRRITPLRDIVSLWRLCRALRCIRPVIVHTHTPKGGLLGLIAAWLSRTPVRVYHLRGLPLVTARGTKRALLRATERLACSLAHRVICVSHSLRNVVVAEGLCPSEKIRVIAGGSGNGVDATGRFDPARFDPAAGQEIRHGFGIPPEADVVCFIGRVVRDKGIAELAHAWELLRTDYPDLHLLVVGPEERTDPVPASARRILSGDPRVHFTGELEDTTPIFAAVDIVVLPSYREGFPNVPLEAAAMRRPVVATQIPGCVDAVVDGSTGLLVPPRDAASLASALRRYLEDPELRKLHGDSGRRRVVELFRREVIWRGIHGEYQELLAQIGSRRLDRARASLESRTKRALDLMLAAFGLTLGAPMLGIAAVGTLITLGRPIIWRQTRPGLHARPIQVLKVRTMRDSVDEAGHPLSDAERLTTFGRILRRTSIDELPQLWNVLRGDMSIVGPRPLLEEYLPLYTEEQARRHRVKPGITGWAQINGRNAASWSDRLVMDVWYARNWSLGLDLRILLRTVRPVLLGKGVTQPARHTVDKFQGARS